MSDNGNKMYCCSRKVQVLVSLFLATVAMADNSAPTYEWTDETGKTVVCQKCPPGTYVARHCTSTSTTDCQPCPEQHYTQYWHYLEKCRFCNVFCQEGEQVKHECNATLNRVCECQPGYHLSGQYCVKDLQCNFQDNVKRKDDKDCDNLVIDFIISLNLSNHTLRRLEQNITKHRAKMPVSERRVRNLLRMFQESNPNHLLLLPLLNFLGEIKMVHLEKKLRKRFLGQEEA